MARSAEAITWGGGDAVLFAALGSGSLPLTGALLVMVAGVAGAVALIVTVELAPEASEPAVQVTVPEALVHPELAETKVTPAGRVSVTVEPVLASGPLFLTVTV